MYKGFECVITAEGILLVRNDYASEWIRLDDKDFELDHCIINKDDVSALNVRYWSIDPYIDSDKTWKMYRMQMAM